MAEQDTKVVGSERTLKLENVCCCAAALPPPSPPLEKPLLMFGLAQITNRLRNVTL